MNRIPSFSADDQQRFEEQLPWYVNGTLDPSQRTWMDEQVAKVPLAAALLAREEALCRAVPGMLASAAQEVGLEQLMARVRADRMASGSNRKVAQSTNKPGLLSTLQRWLTQPAWATAMALVVVAQAGTIGWFMQERNLARSEIRSSTVTEVRTLRVTFQPTASEAQIRAALLGAGARIIGGPNQLGEYWVASGMVSLDEIKASLVKSGLVMTMEVDLMGPRGQ